MQTKSVSNNHRAAVFNTPKSVSVRRRRGRFFVPGGAPAAVRFNTTTTGGGETTTKTTFARRAHDDRREDYDLDDEEDKEEEEQEERIPVYDETLYQFGEDQDRFAQYEDNDEEEGQRREGQGISKTTTTTTTRFFLLPGKKKSFERIQRFETGREEERSFFCRPEKKTRPPRAPDEKEGEDILLLNFCECRRKA